MLRNALLLGALAVTVAGCTNYYHVKDPTTGRSYYTRMIWDKPGGGISFEDAVSGSDITLQNSEVSKVTSDRYRAVAGHRHIVDVDDDDRHTHYARPAGGRFDSDRHMRATHSHDDLTSSELAEHLRKYHHD